MIDIVQLKRRIKQNLEILTIFREAYQRLGGYLEVLKKHDFETYLHNLRVSLIGTKAALFLSLDPKPILYAGLAHDLGKIGVNPELLRKTGEFTKEDRGEIKKHPLMGYLMLKERFPFSAEILLRHHRFQEDPYPDYLPDNQYSLDEIALIEEYARLLALADFCDALASRKNQRFGEIKNRKELQRVMIEHNPDQELLIKELFLQGVF